MYNHIGDAQCTRKHTDRYLADFSAMVHCTFRTGENTLTRWIRACSALYRSVSVQFATRAILTAFHSVCMNRLPCIEAGICYCCLLLCSVRAIRCCPVVSFRAPRCNDIQMMMLLLLLRCILHYRYFSSLM